MNKHYHVESFQGFTSEGWHCVCDEVGYNVLSGAKFTTLEAASEICKNMNGESDDRQNNLS